MNPPFDTLVVMPQDKDVKAISFVFSDGEVITLPYGGERISSERVVNGGLQETAEILGWLAAQTATGIIGGLAWDAVKLGYRSLKLRLSWGNVEDKRQYLSYIAQVAVAAKLDKPSSTEVASCEQQGDHWEAVVKADGRVYRVRFPLNDFRPTAISIDLE